VFNSYRKIKTATSSKGNSKLIFTSSTKSFEYNLDGKEDFIDSIVGNKFYNDSEFTIIDSLSSIICLPTGCFELEK
jgi:archaellum biogenesis ATPase FlaH